MPSATSNTMPTSTSPTSSRTERTGRLTGPVMTVEDFDSILTEFGARPATPEESRISREAQIRAGLEVD